MSGCTCNQQDEGFNTFINTFSWKRGAFRKTATRCSAPRVNAAEVEAVMKADQDGPMMTPPPGPIRAAARRRRVHEASRSDCPAAATGDPRT